MVHDDAFRREEDRRLRERIETLESRIVSLTSAQKTTDDDIDDLAVKVAEVDELLHGDRAGRDSGVVGQLNVIESKVNSILAILHPDMTGHGGLIREHVEIKHKVLGHEKSKEHWIVFWSKVVVAIIGLVGLVLTAWPKLYESFQKDSRDLKAMNRKIERAKHPRRTIYVPKVRIPEPDEDSKESE